MTGPTLCFIDTETTGLDPDQHEVWEVACIIRSPTDAGPVDMEHAWQLPVDLARADPMALNIGRFHERRHAQALVHAVNTLHEIERPPNPSGGASRGGTYPQMYTMVEWAARFAKLTWGARMIGMVPSFDTDRLWRLLRANGACPGWHYQPVDVETLVAGYLLGVEVEQGDATDGHAEWAHAAGALARRLPWPSNELSMALGVKPPEGADRHSALGDARWARDLWDAVHEGCTQ